LNHAYWNFRYKQVATPAPRDILVMSLDDLREYGNTEEAAILLRVRRMMPREVLLDAKVKTGAGSRCGCCLGVCRQVFRR
jgi:hypothetical protein